MLMTKCPVCGENLEDSGYDGHLAWRHPDFENGWYMFKPEAKPERVEILDESDGDDC